MSRSMLFPRRTAYSAAVILPCGLLPTVAGTGDRDDGGDVLPPWARPYGYSLGDMTREVALFTTTGNELTYYPDTPFQLLYHVPLQSAVPAVDAGIDVTATN